MTRAFTILHKTDDPETNKRAIKKLFELWEELKAGKWSIEASEITKRSLPQNKYYWQILTHYVQPGLYNLGWREIKTKDDAHYFIAKIFLKVKMVNEKTGEETEKIRSTTDLTKEEFQIYCEEIRQWGSEYLGVYIPEPNETVPIGY
jgi:hypothetical protein